MAYKNIPNRSGWQFKDDPTNPGFARSALHNKQVGGVRTTGLTQVYTETKKTTDPDGKNRGEISATFYNKEVKPASFFSSLPAVGGGGGGGQPSLSGSHTYDTEFGYLVAYLSLDTSWEVNARTKGDFGISSPTANSIMTDADYATVMSDATHITILVGDFGSGDQSKLPSDPTFTHKGIVYTKQQVVTDPNVTTMNTTNADTLGRESAVGAYNMFWHDEDTGTDLTGDDASILAENAGKLREIGSSSLGYNNVSAVGGVALTGTEREYSGNWLSIWVTNSGVAPVLA